MILANLGSSKNVFVTQVNSSLDRAPQDKSKNVLYVPVPHQEPLRPPPSPERVPVLATSQKRMRDMRHVGVEYPSCSLYLSYYLIQ